MLGQASPYGPRAARRGSVDELTPPGDPAHWYSGHSIDGQNNGTLTDLDAVTAWVDLAGSDDLAPGSSNAPEYRESASSRLDAPGVRFDPANTESLEVATFSATLSQPNLVAVVFELTAVPAVATNPYIVDGPAAGPHSLVTTGGAPPPSYQWNSGAWRVQTTDPPDADSVHDIILLFDSPASDFYKDGTNVHANQTTGTASMRGLYLGTSRAKGATDYQAMNLWEVVVYDTPPDPADLHAYFEERYGASFPIS